MPQISFEIVDYNTKWCNQIELECVEPTFSKFLFGEKGRTADISTKYTEFFIQFLVKTKKMRVFVFIKCRSQKCSRCAQKYWSHVPSIPRKNYRKNCVFLCDGNQKSFFLFSNIFLRYLTILDFLRRGKLDIKCLLWIFRHFGNNKMSFPLTMFHCSFQSSGKFDPMILHILAANGTYNRSYQTLIGENRRTAEFRTTNVERTDCYSQLSSLKARSPLTSDIFHFLRIFPFYTLKIRFLRMNFSRACW